VKKQPFLEELDITDCCFIGTDFFEYVGTCCPLFKSLKFWDGGSQQDNKSDDIAFAIAKTMPRLRHLAILNNGVTNDGLLAILDGCPLLESLDLRGCQHLVFDGSLGKRCKEQIKELRFPTESVVLNSSFFDFVSAGCFRHISNMTPLDFSWIEEIPYDSDPDCWM
jgi:F-box/leucine-rich repeat protein 2/20